MIPVSLHFLRAFSVKLTDAMPHPSMQNYLDAFDAAADELQSPTPIALCEIARSESVHLLLTIATLNNRPIPQPDRELVKFVDHVFCAFSNAPEPLDTLKLAAYVAMTCMVNTLRFWTDSDILQTGKSKKLYSQEPYWVEAALIGTPDACTLATCANILGLSGTLKQVSRNIGVTNTQT